MSELLVAELLHSSIRQDLKSREDALLCLLHAVLLSNRFRCLGTGEDFQTFHTESTEEKTEPAGSVTLPNGWNNDQNVYSLMYQRDDKKLVHVKAAKAPNRLIIAITVEGSETNSCPITINRFVNEDLQNFQQLYQNVDELMEKLKSSLLDHVLVRPTEQKDSKQTNNFQVPGFGGFNTWSTFQAGSQQPGLTGGLQSPSLGNQQHNQGLFGSSWGFGAGQQQQQSMTFTPPLGNADLNQLGGGIGGGFLTGHQSLFENQGQETGQQQQQTATFAPQLGNAGLNPLGRGGGGGFLTGQGVQSLFGGSGTGQQQQQPATFAPSLGNADLNSLGRGRGGGFLTGQEVPPLFRQQTQGPGQQQQQPATFLPQLGNADLNPFAGGRGGGMLMDPRSMVPRGQGNPPRQGGPNVPGIRFDPIFPFPRQRNPNPNPNPDDLKPPGFDDEYIS